MLKIYGERNTGTNYVWQLLQVNLDVQILAGTAPTTCQSEADKDAFFKVSFASNLGWKHCIAPDQSILGDPRYADVQFVTVTKNLYPWLISFFRRPYHYPGASRKFSEFIRSPVPSVGRERLAAPLANPVLLWNAKCRSYLGLPESRRFHARYETLLGDPRLFVEEVARRFGLGRSRLFFSNVMLSTKGVPAQFPDYQRFYLGEHWKSAFSPEDLAYVRGHLDVDLMNRLGYAAL
ncbi:MAG: hypothetical protein ABSB42_22585 [Tepidisphaeraceae bacterium]|jgi:hypothetical protein